MNGFLLPAAAILLAVPVRAQLPSIQSNDNRTPAGTLRHGVLTIRLEAREGTWHPEAEDGFGIAAEAFAEAGGRLLNPGPLIRVPEGTEIRAKITNRLPGKTLVLHGLVTRPSGPDDSLVVGAGRTREVRFLAGAPGTYFYWGTTTGRPLGRRRREDSQLSGVIVVDPAGSPAPDDRIFLIGVWLDSLTVGGVRDLHEIPTINGKMFPFTDPQDYTVGDTVRWRWVNASDREHPMHLHGFYYRVDSRGDAARDTVYAAPERRLVVTELLESGATMAATWVPERPGNWVFHCHILFHVSADLSLTPPAGETHHAGMMRMSGLLLSLRVRPGAGSPAEAPSEETPQRVRLHVQSRPRVYGADPGLGFVVEQNGVPPAPDSVDIPGRPIVLTRGRPVELTVINHLPDPAAVHWHGIELESYYDGVPGMSGTAGRLMPPIAPGDSFTARFTPVRPGTFIYHTHIDDVKQMMLGLYGPLIVLEPGQQWDPATDHPVLLGLVFGDSAAVLLNGRAHPDTIDFQAGVAQRLRLIAIPVVGTVDMVLLSDTTVLRWRALAKDGADLPPGQQTERPSVQLISVGETYDFSFTPAAPGLLRIEARSRRGEVLAVLPIRVR